MLKVLQQALPHEDFLYIGDTARTPYGQRPEKEIRAMVHDLTDYLDMRALSFWLWPATPLPFWGTESIRNGYAFDVVGMSKGAELALGVTKNKKNRRNGNAFYRGKRRGTRLPLTRLTQTRKFLRRAAPILYR